MTPRLAPGALIDAFVLERLLHSGNMSELWVVDCPSSTFPLVMKMPRLDRGYDPAAIVAFEVEQMILPTLSGCHVPRFVAASDFSGQPYIVMERIEAASLRPRLDDAPLDTSVVAAIGAQVADALHDIHSQHVIHLDVKPSNILLRPEGGAVLVDFGLARHDRLPDLLAEEFEKPIGTAPYIAPEQVVQVRNDLRSDIFALGVMLYHLTTGQRPFGNPSTVVGLRRRLYRDAVPPRALIPGCPPSLQEIILRCLEIDPAERYDTAAQLAFDLRHLDQVELTSRAHRTGRDPLARVAHRWMHLVGARTSPRQSAHSAIAIAPIVVLAIDLAQGSEALAESLRNAIKQLLGSRPKARLACLTILKTSRLAMDPETDEHGTNLHVKSLMALKHWAGLLELPANRITFHVIQAHDTGAAIVNFARANQADHIVIGARSSSTLRRYIGSVSSQVVAEAPCSVTVVRTHEHEM